MHQSALAGRIYGNEFVVLITDGAQNETCSYTPRCKDAAMCTSLLVSEATTASDAQTHYTGSYGHSKR
jgi:hypothetical protein